MASTISRWWHSISLRTKITAVTVLLMTVGLAVSGLGTMTVLHDYLIDDVNAQLTPALAAVTPRSAPNDSRSGPTQFVFARFTLDGALIDANSPWKANAPAVGGIDAAWARAHAGTTFTVRDSTGAPDYRLAVKQQGDEIIVLGLPLTTANHTIARLFTLFFVFGILVVLVGAVLTRLLVASTFAPLRQVERTAAAFADGDFAQRLGNTTANTEVGRLNRSLNRMLNQIDRALSDRARTIDQMRRFVGDASHELRTPLVSVRGYAELYRMGALQTPEDVARAMDRIEREAIRLGALVNDLLALARLDEAKPLRISKVELLPLAHDAALDARALAPGRLIRVIGHDPDLPTGTITVLTPVEIEETDTVTSPGPRRTGSTRFRRARRRQALTEQQPVAAVHSPASGGIIVPIVRAEEDKLRQVLANIVGNAIRFTPDDSPIEIAAYADGVRRVAVLEVIDHGEGIPPQIRDKIFQRFWRADSSRTRDTGGSGLGLAIVQAIVAAHDGSIGISETRGGGATFRLSFPLLPNDGDEGEIHSSGTAAALARTPQ